MSDLPTHDHVLKIQSNLFEISKQTEALTTNIINLGNSGGQWIPPQPFQDNYTWPNSHPYTIPASPNYPFVGTNATEIANLKTQIMLLQSQLDTALIALNEAETELEDSEEKQQELMVDDEVRRVVLSEQIEALVKDYKEKKISLKQFIEAIENLSIT